MQTLLTKLESPDKPTTEVPGYQFNSYCKFNGNYLACTDDKLSEFSGDDLDGTAIDAYFEIAQIDFGVSNHKRLKFLYLTFEATKGDKLEIVATPDEDTSKAMTVSFTAIKTGKQTIRGRCPRGNTGTYWLFHVRNTLGADFAISRIEVQLHTLRSRRH